MPRLPEVTLNAWSSLVVVVSAWLLVCGTFPKLC